MPDDKSNRGQPDRSLVSMSEGHEVSYWTARFGVSRDRLKEAIEAVGHSATDVERHLNG